MRHGKKNALAGIAGLITGLVPASITSMFGEMQSAWYNGLIKPELTPPGWVFSVVWSLLYFILGIAGYRIYKTRNRLALALFAMNILLNLLWQPLFIYTQDLCLALYCLYLIWISLLIPVVLLRRNKQILALLTPYLLWITFAAFLNYRLCILNN